MDLVVPFDRLEEAIEEDAERKVRKMLVSMFAHLDSASPIGRPELWESPAPEGYRPGMFKASWKVIIGKPSSDGEETSRRGKGDDSAIDRYKLGIETHILNNTPYAERLHEGWSTQAPIGWVDAALRAGIKYGSR